MRLAFEYTLDESVDTTLRAMKKSKTVRAIHSRDVWITTVVSTLAAFLSWNISSGGFTPRRFNPIWLTISLVVSIVVGAIIFYLYAAFYQRMVRRRVRLVVAEQFEKTPDHTCEIEVRSLGLWARQGNIEVMNPWTEREEVVDTGDAVEVHFRNGLVIVRNRAFESDNQRAEFVSVCRTGAGLG